MLVETREMSVSGYNFCATTTIVQLVLLHVQLWLSALRPEHLIHA